MSTTERLYVKMQHCFYTILSLCVCLHLFYKPLLLSVTQLLVMINQ